MTDPSTPDALLRRVAELEAEVRRLTAALGGREREHRTTAAGPIFVGGTGRSGTWVVGRLLDRHPDIVTVRTELRFHASEGGFRPVLDGVESPEEFAERVRTRWFALEGPDGRAKGPFLLAAPKELRAATRDLLEIAQVDVRRGLETFTRRLVDPYALGRGASTWVETTPDNAAQVDCLLEVFPDARAIQMIRDGRDVAASVVTMPWGPSTFEDALAWWEERVHEADEARRRADTDRVLVVRLEELIHLDRQGVFDRLMALVQLENTRLVEKYFEQRMDAGQAKIGRWRREVSPRDAGRIDDAYRGCLERLRAAGVDALPVDPDVIDELARSLDQAEASPSP